MLKIPAGRRENGVLGDGDAADWKRRIGRQRERRQGAADLWSRLDDLLVLDAGPTVTRQGLHRSQALKSGRTRAELLGSAIVETRKLMAPGALQQACTAQAGASGALEQAYTTQAGAGLIAIDLKTGRVAYQSPSFQDLTSWIPAEMRGNIRVSLQSGDGEYFHRFCQLVVRDAGEPYGETFLGRDNVVGRSLTVRFFTRVPGPTGLRNPEWLLMVRQVMLTLVGVQPQQAAAGRRLPFVGQRTIPEAVGVFTADLSGGTPQQWTLQVAHVRYLLDMEVAAGTYDIQTPDVKPLEILETFFDCGFSKEEGCRASVFSRAATQLEYATTSALSIASRGAAWLARAALRTQYEAAMRLNDDDTVLISAVTFVRFYGGLSASVAKSAVAGKLGFCHGGLDVTCFIADPEQPLDGNLRATLVRYASRASAKIGAPPMVFDLTWGYGNFRTVCSMIDFDRVGTKSPEAEDVSQLFEKLNVSPGGGHLIDSNATICIAQSDV